MDIAIKQTRSRLMQPMKVLAENYYTSFTNGINLLVKLGTSSLGQMDQDISEQLENPGQTETNMSGQMEIHNVLSTSMTVATIPDNAEKQVSIANPDFQLGRVPVGMKTKKYGSALQTLYVVIPDQLREVKRLIHTLFSKRILLKSDLERLRCAVNAEGETAQVVKLLDILMAKSEDQIKIFIEVLDEFNQNPLASLIRKTADEYELQFYNGNIMTQEQVLANVCQGNTSEIIKQKALQEDSYVKAKRFDFILNAVPLPNPEGNQIQCFVGNKGHLQVCLTTLMGNQMVMDRLNHAFYKLKSQFFKSVGVTCNCTMQDQRKDDKETESSCDALVSVGLVEGEKKAFEMLESKMLELENFMLQGHGHIVSIIEGCIKVAIQVNDSYHLEALHHDIKSGTLLYRITEWLKKEGYSCSESPESPAFMLTVDKDAIQALKSSLKKEEQHCGNRLSFPVSYTYCPHEQKWYWSPDRTYWFDHNTKCVLHGIYKNKMVGEVDEMLLTEMEKSSIRPSSLPDHCIPCTMRNETRAKLSLTVDYKAPVSESKAKQQMGATTDHRSGLSMITLSEICNHVCPKELFNGGGAINMQQLFKSEMEALFYDMLKESQSGQMPLMLEYYGNIFSEMPFENNTEDVHFHCLFISQNNPVGYSHDTLDDANTTVYDIVNEELEGNILQLKNKTTSAQLEAENDECLSSAQKSREFSNGINQIIDNKYKTKKEMYCDVFPGHHQNQGFEKGSDTFTWYPSKHQTKGSFSEQSSFHTIQGCTTVPIRVNSTVSTDKMPFIQLSVQNCAVPTNCRVSLAYPCMSWPGCAANWVHRKRLHGWPTEAFIDEVLTKGCHVIPSPSSSNFSWEFCFRIVEKKLLTTLPVQYKQALFLLNIISTQCRALCEFPMIYHWQNTLFWECETNGITHDSVADIFFKMTDRMIAHVSSKEIPDYFIEKCNLIKNYSDIQVANVLRILQTMRSEPVDLLSEHFDLYKCGVLPRSKSLKVIFADALQHEDSIDSCISHLIDLLLQEKNDRAALDHIFLSPRKEVHLKICPEIWLSNIAPHLKIKGDLMFSKYLVESFPKSSNIAKYKGRLALLYLSLSLHGPQIFEGKIESEMSPCADRIKALFKEALHSSSKTNRDLQIWYAYYLFLQKKHEMVIECLQDLIRKPLDIKPELLLRKEFLEKTLWDLSLDSNRVLLWHLPFGLYILIKSCQVLGRKVEAKKYLDQLKEATKQILHIEGGNAEVHITSLGLLGKAASDLEEYKLSSEAYREMSDVQRLLVVTEDSKVSRWFTIPSSVYSSDVKFPFQSDYSKEPHM